MQQDRLLGGNESLLLISGHSRLAGCLSFHHVFFSPETEVLCREMYSANLIYQSEAKLQW